MPKADSTRFVTGDGYFQKTDTVSVLWTKTQLYPELFWIRTDLDTNQFVSVTDLPSLSADTSLFWSKSWDLVDRAELDSQRTADTTKWWTKAWKFINRTTLDSQRTADTNKFITTGNLPNIWLKSVYDPSKFWTSDGISGTKQLDTNKFISTSDLDTARANNDARYWRKTDALISRSTLDSQSVADTSTFWKKTHSFVNTADTVDGNRILTWSKLDNITFKKGLTDKLEIKDYSIDPIKLDTSKLGFGLLYDNGKLTLNTSTESTSEGIPSLNKIPVLGFTTSSDTVYGKSCQYMTWIDNLGAGSTTRWIASEVGFTALHDGAFITIGKNGATPIWNSVTQIKDSVSNDFLKFEEGDYIQVYWIYQTPGDEIFLGNMQLALNGTPIFNIPMILENSIFTCVVEVLYF